MPEEAKSMKSLITGGAGFIGSHLAEKLLRKGEKVVVIDNLSTGSIDNIRNIKNDPLFSYHIDTIMNEKLMRRLVNGCDIIYHMAAAVGVKYIVENPLLSIQTNVRGTEIILELASVSRKKVILASTSEIYGKDRPGKRIFKEDDDRLLGSTKISRWSYSCTKALDEFLALAYNRERALPVIITRFFNTCGPRQTGRYGMVIPRFVSQALAGKSLTIYGDGKQTRSFCHVNDVVDALLALNNNPRAISEVFNIGNPEVISIRQLARKIIEKTGSKSEIKYVPYDKAYESGFEDMRHRSPDITKLRRLTGFKPKNDIDDILADTIKYSLELK
jgi:UDP-glucose 4-epimerase